MGEHKKGKIYTIEDSMKGKTKNSLLHLDDFPKYDLFLSQVIEFIEDLFNDETYTVNIIQNYIKSGVIAKPYHGKKKGYTKLHLIQLVFISFMRPVLTTEEMIKVFHLAFNEIDDREDDIITWEMAYELFYTLQREQMKTDPNMIIDEERIKEMIYNLSLTPEEKDRIFIFISVLALVAKASFIKNTAKDLITRV